MVMSVSQQTPLSRIIISIQFLLILALCTQNQSSPLRDSVYSRTLKSTRLLANEFKEELDRPRVRVSDPKHHQIFFETTNIDNLKDATLPVKGFSQKFQLNGGKVLTETAIPVYLVWYGNWNQQYANQYSKSVIQNFIRFICPSNPYLPSTPTLRGWWAITVQYYSTDKKNVQPCLVIGGEANDTYSQGNKTIDSITSAKIVERAISKNLLPHNSNGVYFVLTSPDVVVEGFGIQNCGWHYNASINGKSLYIGVVGNIGTKYKCTCSPFCKKDGPSQDNGADAMVYMLSSLLPRIVTNPELNGWADNITQKENGDICAWDFGDVRTDPNTGYIYNVIAYDFNFFVQSNYDLYSKSCSLQASKFLNVSCGPDSLTRGEKLEKGFSLFSKDGSFHFDFEVNGNLVLYFGGAKFHPIWEAKTTSVKASHLVLQNDGNLVLYRNDSTSLWSSKTKNKGVILAKLVKGTLALITRSNTLWTVPFFKNVPQVPDSGESGQGTFRLLSYSQVISYNQRLVSPNGNYYLKLSNYGSLSLNHINGMTIWSTPRYSYTPDDYFLVFQLDAHLAVYRWDMAIVWLSYTYVPGLPQGVAAAYITNFGKLIITRYNVVVASFP